MAKKRETDLGKHLRKLRDSAGMTLREVANKSKLLASEGGEQLSHGYLSAVETGRVSNIGPAKLISLAHIYATTIDELARHLPPDQANRLIRTRFDLGQRPEYHSPVPFEQLSASDRIYALISERADQVLIPVGREKTARARIFDTIIRWSCVPLLLQERPELSADYLGRVVPTKHTRTAGPAWYRWRHEAEALADWLIYRTGLEEVVSSRLASWSIDFDQDVATVVFEGLDEFGFEQTPCPVIEATGIARCVVDLSPLIIDREQLDPPVAPRAAAAHAYLTWLLCRRAGHTGFWDKRPPAIAIRAATDMYELIELGDDTYDQAIQSSVLDLLRRL